MKIIIIAAVSKNNVIGKNGLIPWDSSEEMNHFRETTIGYPVIMGRKTWESLKHPLSERTNIVLTHQQNYKLPDDINIFHSLTDSLSYCESELFEKCFIIGGAQIYNEGMKYSNEIIISRMKFDVKGDSYFPKIDSSIWEEKTKTEFEEFCVHVYIRKENNSRELIG